MSAPAVINVSPHVLMDVITCETKAWLRHKRGYTSRTEHIKAVAGQGFHGATATLFDPHSAPISGTNVPLDFGLPSAQRAVNEFHRIYDPAWAALDAAKLDPALTPQNLDRVLRRWIEMHPPSLLPWTKVLLVEEAFVSRTFRVGHTQVNLIVRPDLVVEDQFGKIRWVDTKTTGWRISADNWRKKLKLSLQIQLYSDAMVQRFGDKATLGGWINAIEMRKLPGDTEAAPKLKKDGTPAKARNCSEHGVPYAECGHEHAKAEFIECLTTPEKVQRGIDDALRASVQYVEILSGKPLEALNTFGTANEACGFCPAAEWCDSSRPEAAVETWADFIHSPWVVETGKR